MTTVSTRVYAAAGCTGQFEELRRRNGTFEARTVKLYTFGPREVSRWEQIDNDEAARILGRADGRVPASWREAADA